MQETLNQAMGIGQPGKVDKGSTDVDSAGQAKPAGPYGSAAAAAHERLEKLLGGDKQVSSQVGSGQVDYGG